MSKKTKAELLAEYKEIAKRADRRLRNLEKAATTRPYFKPAMEWAYARAMKDIESRFGAGVTRFDRRLPKKTTRLQIIAAISDVQTFLDAPTSSLSGIKNVYIKRTNTINKEYGTDYKWEDLADLLSSGQYDRLANTYGSQTTWKTIGEMQKKKKEIAEEMNLANSNHKRISREDESKINKEIADRLEKRGLTLGDLV